MRIILDTNLYISAALIPGSFVDRVVRWCLEHGEVYFSQSTYLELKTRITRNKFDQDRYQTLEQRMRFVESILSFERVLFCDPKEVISVITEDEPDNRILEVAVECQAEYIITGNRRHFKPLHPFRGIAILEPREFYDQVIMNVRTS